MVPNCFSAAARVSANPEGASQRPGRALPCVRSRRGSRGTSRGDTPEPAKGPVPSRDALPRAERAALALVPRGPRAEVGRPAASQRSSEPQMREATQRHGSRRKAPGGRRRGRAGVCDGCGDPATCGQETRGWGSGGGKGACRRDGTGRTRGLQARGRSRRCPRCRHVDARAGRGRAGRGAEGGILRLPRPRPALAPPRPVCSAESAAPASAGAASRRPEPAPGCGRPRPGVRRRRGGAESPRPSRRAEDGAVARAVRGEDGGLLPPGMKGHAGPVRASGPREAGQVKRAASGPRSAVGSPVSCPYTSPCEVGHPRPPSSRRRHVSPAGQRTGLLPRLRRGAREPPGVAKPSACLSPKTLLAERHSDWI